MPIVLGLGEKLDLKDPLGLYKNAPGLSAPKPVPVSATPAAPANQPQPKPAAPAVEPNDWNDLVNTVIAEAAGEGPEGMAAVAHVIKNRAAVRQQGVGDVIRAPKQFTGYEAPGPEAVKAQQDPAMRAKAEEILHGVFAGEVPDPTGGSDHYHADTVSPDWAGKMEKTAQIGAHAFYRADRPAGNPSAKGLARLAPPEPELPKDGGGNLIFAHEGQDKLDDGFRSVLLDTSVALGRDFRVTSGYRSPEHPVEAAKKKPGMHATGRASDISMKGMSIEERQQLVLELQARGVKRFGIYKNTPDMLHVDMKDQTGSGDPWFMYDRTNKKLHHAPGWFQDLAAGKVSAHSASYSGSSRAIKLDEGFRPSDPMGLYSGGAENPFAVKATPAKPEVERAPLAPVLDTSAEDALAELEKKEPGRYRVLDEIEYETWKADWEAANRSGGLAGDTGRLVKAGFADLGLAARAAVGAIPKVGPVAVRTLDSIDEWMRGDNVPAEQKLQRDRDRATASLTPEMQAAREKNWIREEEQPDGTIKFLPGEAWADPRTYIGGLAESVPSTVVTMGPAGVLARGAFTAAIARGAGEKAAAAAAARTATIAGALSEGTIGGGQAAQSIREQIAAMPSQALESSDAVKQLMAGGLTFEDAVASVQQDASTQAFVLAGAATGAFGGLGDRALAKIIAEGVGGGIVKRVLGGAGRGAVAEGVLEEAPQSALSQAAQNKAMQTVDPSIPLSRGVADAAAGGAVLGATMGAGLGGAGGAVSRAEAPDPAAGRAAALPPPAPPAPRRGPLTSALEHGSREVAKAAQTFTVNDPPIDGLGAGEMHGQSVTLAPDQANVPAGMRRVVGQDGTARLMGDRLLVAPPPSPAAAAPTPLPAPEPAKTKGRKTPAAPEGAPAVGEIIRVEAEGLPSFVAQIESYEGDEAIVLDVSTGEVLQIPLDKLPAGKPRPTTETPAPAARPVPTKITAGMRANLEDLGWSPDQLRKMTPAQADEILRAGSHPETAPVDENDAALEPQPAQAAQASAELPPVSEDKPALERFPGAPEPGKRVIVAAEGQERFSARVQTYENGSKEALVVKDDGTALQVPVVDLYVNKLTPKQVEAQDLKRDPPVTRAKVTVPTGRDVHGKQMVLPDDKHARLFDVGKLRRDSAKTLGRGALDRDRVMPAEQRKLADEFGVSPEALGQMADDYRYRVERAAKEARSQLPVKMHPVNAKRLKSWQSEHARKGTSLFDASDESEKINTAAPADADEPVVDNKLAGGEQQAAAASDYTEVATAGSAVTKTGKTYNSDTQPSSAAGASGVANAALRRSRAAQAFNQATSAGDPALVTAARSEFIEAMTELHKLDREQFDHYANLPGNRVTFPELQNVGRNSLDEAAQAAATSPLNDRPEPTQAQKEAGNYAKGHVSIGGLDLSIENPAGSKRSGTSASGKPWSVEMQSHYGYIKGTVGRDKDHIDTFVKPGTSELADDAPVFVVDQRDPARGKFDEHKVMIGFGDEAEARAAYLANYTKNWKGLGAITPTTLGRFKAWLEAGDTSKEFARAKLQDVMSTMVPAEDSDELVSQQLTSQGPWDFNDTYPAPDEGKLAAQAAEGRYPLEGGDGERRPEQVAGVLEETLTEVQIRHLDIAAAEKRIVELATGQGAKSRNPEKEAAGLKRSIAEDRRALIDIEGALLEAWSDEATAKILQEGASRAARERRQTDPHVEQPRIPKEKRKPSPSKERSPADAQRDKFAEIDAGFAANRAVLGNFKKGDKVEFTHKDFHREPQANGSRDRVFTGTMVKISEKSQGIVEVKGDGGQTTFVAARNLRKGGTSQSVPKNATTSGATPQGTKAPASENATTRNPKAAVKADRRALTTYAEGVVGPEIVSVSLVGSQAARGKGRDIDLLYDLGDVALPTDPDEAADAIEKIIERTKISVGAYDTHVRAGGRYFVVQMGAGAAVVENTEYGREQEGKPTVLLALRPGRQETPAEFDARLRARREADEAAAASADDPFAGNKLFTADKVAAAKARLKSKLGQINSGIDPEVLVDGMTIAGAYIEAGVRSFADYAAKMAADFGPSIRPYLLSFWEGARNYPGLDTAGMTSIEESARLHAEANRELPKEEAPALGSEVAKPKRTKKTGRPEDRTLTQDFGVEHIDGYGTDSSREIGNDVKDAFLKDATQYLRAVAGVLTEQGFTPPEDAKGRPMKPVHQNESGPATSGEVSLTMRHADTGATIYAHVGETSLRGVVPTTASGIAVMYRTSKEGSDRYAARGINRWAPTGLSAGELAAMISREAGGNAPALVRPAVEAPDEPAELDRRGPGALEGAPSEPLQGDVRRRQARIEPTLRGRADAPRDEPAGEQRVSDGRGLADGEGGISSPETGGDAEPANGRIDDASDGEGGESGPTVHADRVEHPSEGVSYPSSAATPAAQRPVEYTITEADELGAGGAKSKFRNNVAAIRLIRTLAEEDRPANRDEQSVLAKWVGWGGLRAAFAREDGSVNKGWEKEAAELKELLTPEEFRAAESSTRNAHYTSPEVVTAIWSIVDRLGFTGGRVLEPSIGAGNFIGLMPAGVRDAAQVTGVELDHITGGIAKNLYPKANIQAPKGFQELTIPDNYFDLAIGNPPFGSEKLYDADRRHLNKFSIHNFFFAKAIDTLKPGGVLAMVVTNYFLDASDAKARAYIAARADLVGAIRLPNNAFLKNAGTEVTTDIIILRKRAPEEVGEHPVWLNVSTWKDKEGREVPINAYFRRHPDMMLGEFGAYGTMYRGDEAALVSRPDDDLRELLDKAIASLPKSIMAPAVAPVAVVEETVPTSAADAMIGSMFLADDGAIYLRKPDLIGNPQAEKVDGLGETAIARITGMLRIRDAFTRLRHAQISDGTMDAQIAEHRKLLNDAYDPFVKAHGPLNADANKRLLRDDPTWPQISALEDNFDKGISPAVARSTGEKARKPSARKAAIFTKRTQQPYQRPTSATSAKDALAQVLADHARVDIAAMQRLYDRSEEQIVAELGPLLFRTPAGVYETADHYLSGNVKAKLAEALRAAEQDPSMQRNVSALREVIPADIEAVDIDVKPGAPWVPSQHIAAFIEHIAEAKGAKAFWSAANAKWAVEVPHPSPAADAQFSTGRTTVKGVLEAVLNGQTLTVYDKLSDGKSVLNQVETDAANEKAEKVKAEWRRWLWEDDARRTELARLYNDTFNTDVLRRFDGSHLQLPGKVSNDIISLRPHQMNFIWRTLQGGTTLADHTVGAGKTFALIASAMEKRRTGQARKPIFVVPNHLVGQWAADFIKLYPGARVLATTKRDFEADNRKRLFARIATGDWDAVIVAHSSFGKIGVSPEFEKRFIGEQLDDLERSMTALRQATGEKSRNVAQLKAWRAHLEAKLQKLMDAGAKDEGLTFDELGVDAIYLDEAHEFKNLAFSTSMTRVAGLGNPMGSQKAADLFMKMTMVLERTNGQNVVFATGTPLSNTMAEMYTVQRYLDMPALKALGIAHFDAWARVFGEIVTDWELSPSGQYKLNSRFAKFVNMPELMQRYLSFADVVTNDDIKAQMQALGKTLPLPKVKGGKPLNVVVDRSAEQAAYIGVGTTDAQGVLHFPEGSLVWRAENLPKGKPEKGADNMLKVMSDARKAALDMRLINPSYPDAPGSKVHSSADNIKRLYDAWDAKKGTQLVFIDLSTPKKAQAKEQARIRDLMAKAEAGDEAAQQTLDNMSPDEFMALDGDFSVYDDLKKKLIDRGIPEGEIAFIHDANTDLQKEELFGKVRSGRVRVLFGSTAKMGAGTNVQNRLVGMHHLDAPWRPSDLEQREGRIIRQGNELYAEDPDGFEVEILRYATKNTLDARMWQTIEGKARFISQVRKGGWTSREIEDIAGETANAAEMKAAASGNPLILEEMDLRQKLRRLEGLSVEHDREQHRIKGNLKAMSAEKDRLSSHLALAEAEAVRAREFMAVPFSAEILGVTHEKPGAMGAAIIAAGRKMVKEQATDPLPLGNIARFTLRLERTADVFKGDAAFNVDIEGEYARSVQIVDIDEADAVGLAQRINNTIRRLADEPDAITTRITEIERQSPALAKQIGPWKDAPALEEARARHREVIAALQPKKAPAAPAAAAPEGAQASAAPAGWEMGENDALPLITEADQDRIAEIIRKVAGLTNITFMERINLPNGAPGWGKTTPTTAGGFYNPSQDAITVALDSGSDKVAYHEAFHRLQHLFLTQAERAVLQEEAGRLRRIVGSTLARRDQASSMSQSELEAEAFAIYVTGAGLPVKPHKLVQALWDRIATAVRRVRNFLNGRGFQTIDDVFDRAKAGEIKNRSADPRGSGVRYSISEARVVEEVRGKFTDWQPGLLATIPLNYFIELARPNMTAIADYLKVKRMLDAYRGKKHAAMDEIAQGWLKFVRLGKSKSAALASLMHDATLAGVDPSKTDAENRAQPEYEALRKRFLALPRAGQELFAKVRDAYKAQADELDRILLDNVKKAQQVARDRAEAEFKAELEQIAASKKLSALERREAVKEATLLYQGKKQRAEWSMKARVTRLRLAFESSRVTEPYFPLARFGRYFVVVRDVDGDVISFSRRETAADRDRLARDMRAAFPTAKVEVGVTENSNEMRQAMDPRILAEIESIVGGAGMSGDSMTTVLDQIWQRYLQTMPDLSVRKRFIHRKGTAGFEGDALRAFSSHMFHAAHQMGRLKYGIELQELVNNASDQAKKADDPTKGMTLANELRLRHKWVMNPTGGSFAQVMTSTAFIWYLGTTPAAAAVNTAQTFMLGIPILGARFGGIAKAAGALLKASADSVAGRGSVTRANLSAEDKAALEAFYESGLIDRTQSHDLAGVGETGVRYSPMRARVMAAMSFLFHKAEVWNREVTAIAAYRMARLAGQNVTEAIDTAHDMTWKTHFDYSNSSRPRLMQNDFAKVALVFRAYSINMLYRLGRDFRQTFKGETPQARKEARTQLAGVLGMMTLMAGVTGVAGFNLAMTIMGAVAGDDDEMDFEQTFRKSALDLLGPELGGVLLNGVPGHYLGIDLSSRLGMPDLWFRSPSQDLEGKDEYEYWIMNSLGAVVSLGGDLYRGADLIMDGDVARGVEAVVPKWARDLMKAYRYMDEGLTNLRGDQLIQPGDLTAWDAIAQAIGFTPATVAETYDRNSALMNAERRVQRKRQDLVNAFALATRMKDAEGRADALADIKQFNKSPLGRTVPIKPDTLHRSLRMRDVNARKREDGVLIENERLGKALREKLAEPLYR